LVRVDVAVVDVATNAVAVVVPATSSSEFVVVAFAPMSTWLVVVARRTKRLLFTLSHGEVVVPDAVPHPKDPEESVYVVN
jgi:hypothetical protein